MPLTMAHRGDEFVIKKISGKEEVRRRLEELGFVAGTLVKVVADISGNLIVNVKESRVALDRTLASKIHV